MGEDKKDEQSFRVKDNRRFNADGSAKTDEDQNKEAPPPPLPENNEPEDFEINFTTFVLSLASSVQINLGLIPHPFTNKEETNLPSAKQTIDILGMIEEKTKGNLTREEEEILKRLLYELRLYYVEAVNKAKGNNDDKGKK